MKISEIEQLRKQQNCQIAQIEVKEPKKRPWKFRK